MYAPYGKKKLNFTPVAIYHGSEITIMPSQSKETYSGRFPRCRGCPYPRHGLFCWTDSETCLRTEMAEIERRNRRRLEVSAI